MTVTANPTLIYRPDGEPGSEPLSITPGPTSLAGVRIGVMENAKPNSDVVMGHAAEIMAARVGGTVTVLTGKRLPNSAEFDNAKGDEMGISEGVLQLLKEKADVVITGVADCGSCSAYTAYDTIELERNGIPTILTTTTRFEQIARTLVTDFGLPSARTLVLPHPIGGTDHERLFEWGEQAVDELIIQFGRQV